ncbi:MAG: preprotein translocase subunit SecA [Candidatus Pacebacteria bacterium]|nr:preprotein translocase subunit SecA [Candidatus Paceibacterota bacterium]
MLKFFANLFDENKKTLDKYGKIVTQINDLEPKIKKLSDDKLAAQTKKFKKIIEKEISKGRTEEDILDEILPEAFATVREASRRVLGMRHFDVQLLAGIALHKRSVTEQKTGEGKTLTVTGPLYLNALLGKGAHLITVNDYLAEIGAGWMGSLYNFLGLTTSVVIHDKSKLYNPELTSEDRGDERLEHFEEISRKDAYLADITYGTNNEFGFDYLRDNMVQTLDRMVQRTDNAHHYVIVDEADSILIDEARTPLIISAPGGEPTNKYYDYAKMVQTLVKDIDYKLDEKAKTATLSDLGVKRIEQKLGVKNLYEESFDTIHLVESALKAKTLYLRDKEYIVKENQVVIVDDHTGRLMFGRRYSDGLHQSIEAKEGVPIQQESRTLATISIQNYFRMYHKLSGMTGTAATEAEEFKSIYDTEVLIIPTNKPVIREDMADVVYKTTSAKYSAIAHEVERINKTGRPILIGTKSIEHNQIISNFLKRKKVTHQLLNAKNNEKEAFVISDAGKKGAITVATNIAGRGVDIVLGGAKPEIKDFKKKQAGGKVDKDLVESLNLPPAIDPASYKLKEYAKALKEWKEAHDEVIELGGLHIIGTERHESRRIDNQLRGRSGRQGDAGASQFFLSLEDEIMRIFGGEQISKVMDFLKIEENQPIEHGMIGKAIESAQVKVEGFFFDQRKRLVDFDDVMNKHREIIYKRRRRLLEIGSEETISEEYKDDNLKEQIVGYLHDEVDSMVSVRAPQSFTEDEYEAIVKEFTKIIPFDQASQRELTKNISKHTDAKEIISDLTDIIDQTYEAREKTLGEDVIKQIENYVVLSTVDEKWMEHLENMDALKEGIWLRGDKNTVLSEYKKESFNMFEGLITTIESTIANRIFRIQPSRNQPIRVQPKQGIEKKEDIHESLTKEVQDATVPSPASTNTKGSTSDLAAALGKAKAKKKATPGQKRIKIKRNDPCYCGSGKKYKKCHMLIDEA